MPKIHKIPQITLWAFIPTQFLLDLPLMSNSLIHRIVEGLKQDIHGVKIIDKGVLVTHQQILEVALQTKQRIESSHCFKDWVAIEAGNSWMSYGMILGVWLSGKGYLPINPNSPDSRNQKILEDANCNEVLNYASIQEIKVDINKISIENGALAYLIYTSGTTGKPKGVPITLKNLNAFCSHYENHSKIHFDEESIFLQSYELTFDVSVFCFVMPFLTGGKLVLPGTTVIKYQGLFKAIKDYNVNVVSFVPSVIRLSYLFLDRLSLPTIKYSFFSGESLMGTWAKKWMKVVSNAKVFNCYGPTETVIVCTEEFLNDLEEHYFESNQPLPLGKSFDNVDLSIDNEEIVFSGAQTFSGYLNQASLESFPSGDLAYYDEYKKLIFKGRKDDQIQWNGYRIELLEIENEFRSIGHWVKPIFMNEALFYFSLSDPNIILQSIPDLFPQYYTPSEVIQLKEVPLNRNEKLDIAFLKQLVLDKK